MFYKSLNCMCMGNVGSGGRLRWVHSKVCHVRVHVLLASSSVLDMWSMALAMAAIIASFNVTIVWWAGIIQQMFCKRQLTYITHVVKATTQVKYCSYVFPYCSRKTVCTFISYAFRLSILKGGAASSVEAAAKQRTMRGCAPRCLHAQRLQNFAMCECVS